MKKIFLFAVLLISLSAFGQQTPTLPATGTNTTIQSFINTNGKTYSGSLAKGFRVMAMQSTLDSLINLVTGNFVDLSTDQTVLGIKSFAGPIAVGTYGDPSSSWLEMSIGNGFKAQTNTGQRVNYSYNSMMFVSPGGVVQSIGHNLFGAASNTILTIPQNKGTAIIATTSDIPSLSGYEQTANKQNSLSADGTGIKYPTVDAVNKRAPFVTPEEFGAVGNGVTDDAPAIQDALDSGYPVLLSNKSYNIGSTLLIGSKGQLSGLGEESLIIAKGNFSAIKLVGSDAQIRNIGLVGSDSITVDFHNNHGILVDGSDGMISYLMLDNIFINGFGGSGVHIYDNRPPFYRPSVIANSVTASNCNIGFNFGDLAEYSIFSNCVANENNIGVNISGGNNSFNGGMIVSNRTGVNITDGVNNAHSVMTGTMINHNIEYAVKSDGVTYGYLFNACMLYYGDIYLKNSTGIKITNSDLYIPSFYTENSVTEILGNKWLITPTFHLDWNGTTSINRFFDNNFKLGGQPSYIQSELKEQLTIPTAPINSTDVVRLGDIINYTFINSSGTAPTPTAIGKKGEIRYDGLFKYECIATNTWVRSVVEITW